MSFDKYEEVKELKKPKLIKKDVYKCFYEGTSM